MAQQPDFQPRGHLPQDQYDNAGQQGYDGAPHAGGEGPAAPAGGRRKRQYAGQAYDFGAGANTQPGHGGSFSGPPGVGFEGYNSQPGLQQQPYGADYGAPAPGGQSAYGQQVPTVGGYQPPDQGYPPHGATSMLGGVSGITSGMSGMGISGQSSLTPQQPPQRPHLNQLYPTDMLNQPFHVSEFNLPPPPIVLPPNVSTRFEIVARINC